MMMDSLRRDLGFAARSLMRAPGFTAITVVTLGLGIGSNAAMFGVVKGVLLEPLPYAEPDRVVTVWSSWRDAQQVWVSEAEYRTYLSRARSFEDLAIWNEVDVTFTDPSNPERVLAVGATPNLVDVLGVRMAQGRFFTEEEALRSDSASADAIVISHEAWLRRWNGDPSVVGILTEMNGRTREIVGVLPADFRLPTQYGTPEVADIYFPRWVPRTELTDFPEAGGSHYSYVVGRLRPGATVEEARRELEQAIARVDTELDAYPPDFGFRPLVVRAADDVFAGVRPALMALLATVGLVLLVACANVANLMLARGEDRTDELAVRAALGAGRRRLVGQLTIESLLLAAIGGGLGLALAFAGVDVVHTLAGSRLPRSGDVAVDGGVLAFTAVVALGTAVIFGILPALRSTRRQMSAGLARRATPGARQSRWQGVLVSAQAAMALILAVGAGLMARTFHGLTSIDPGFDGVDVVTVAISLPRTTYDAGGAITFWRDVLRQVEELPGVRSAGAIRSLPLGGDLGDWGLDIEGYDETVQPSLSAGWQIAAPGYFTALGIPLLQGRALDWSDDAEAPLAVIVNQTFASRYWPGESPVGKRIRVGGPEHGPWGSVVGVAGDVQYEELTEPVEPVFYVPVGQWNLATRGVPTGLRLVARASGPPRELVEPIRSVVGRLDPSLAVSEVQTGRELMDVAVTQPRLMMLLMSLFGGIALTLALVGVYGVVSYTVGTRTREIGVRIALGAMHDQIVGLMLRRGAVMVGIGLAVGTAAALVLSRYLESLLYGVEPTDPLTFAAVLVGFATVSAAATYLPSRRAARIDPIQVLKSE